MFAGSAISGHWFKDQVRIGDSFQNNTAVEAKMGCHDSEAWFSGNAFVYVVGALWAE